MREVRGMVALTFHSKFRFVQRVLGIEESNDDEAKKYVEENNSEVSIELWRLFSNAKLFFENFTLDEEKDITGNIYLNQDIIFLVSIKSELITLWKIGHNAQPEEFTKQQKKIIRTINFNKVEISKLDSQKLKSGQEGKKFEFAINKFQEILLKAKNTGEQNSIYLIGEQIKHLQEEYEKIVEEGKNVSLNVKTLKKENRRLMKSFMYGFII